jgi:hypothetical protein
VKIVIGGGCRCGKSTLAEALGREHGLPVYRADDLMHMGWSEASDAFADVIAYGRDGIYEGVAAVRAMRKLIKRMGSRPCTRYLHLTRAWTPLTPRQAGLNTAVETVWRDVAPKLRARGVIVRVT